MGCIVVRPVTAHHPHPSLFAGVVSGVLSERYGERAMAMSGTLLATVGIALGSLSNTVHSKFVYKAF